MNIVHFKRTYLLAFVLSIYLMTSCVNTRKAIYFNGINDATISSNTPIPESIIQKNDLLSISVSSLNLQADSVFNAPNVSGLTNQGVSMSGYLVNIDGTIQFPILGSVKAAGLTKEQLKESISKKLTDQKLLTDPLVSVRFLNFRVTVLGEVKNPAVLNVPNEKISFLEAIGLAGDLTIYAKRDNILIIREENGNKIIKRVNLNSNELLSSPYYYLKSNDIIYVEPNKTKIASGGRGQQWLPAVLSGLSLAAIVIDRLVK